MTGNSRESGGKLFLAADLPLLMVRLMRLILLLPLVNLYAYLQSDFCFKKCQEHPHFCHGRIEIWNSFDLVLHIIGVIATAGKMIM